MNKLTIKDWAVEDRPREKMLRKGISSLSDAELLAILIGSGNSNESAVQLSQRILHFAGNNLNSLGKLTVKELTNRFKGIGQAKGVTIAAALELGRRRNDSERPNREKILCSNDVYRLFKPLVCDLPHEELWIALINQGGKVIEKMKISQGGVTETSADIRLIMKAAINALASGIVLCHNHPSGNPSPSRNDDALTSRLQSAARLMDIKLFDHVVIADNTCYSYADEGKL
ncbi:MAG: DNA repair protein RadC [Tannerellaceae bacterium]|jgi:DNA repair protein RadC|nr:DNA repair protein RadC [Tannerellaceae bacterium]